jgi:hypothetical protein
VSVPLAVSLLALLIALFCLLALVGVYARLRTMEAARAVDLSGYATLVGRPAPPAVHARPGQRGAVVAVLDADCGSCREVWEAMRRAAADGTPRYVGLVPPAASDLPLDPPPPGPGAAGRAELLADPGVRADLFEGYAPTLLAVDTAGTVVRRSFVYPDTDLTALLADLSEGREVSR